MAEGELIRVPEAAARTGLTIRQLYRHIDAGRLPAYRDVQGMVVVPVEALTRLQQR